MDSVYAAAYPNIYRHHWWWRVREDILLDQIRTLLRHTKQPARILDVGCGAGLFFDALQRFGHIEGIESDVTAVERSGKWRSRILHGELNAEFTPSEPFDLILLLDVLEHLNQPDELLRHAARVLRPDGRILITVPAFNWLWTRHDDLNHHVCRYTAKQLRRTVETSGLLAINSTYLFQSLVLAKALVRLQEWVVRRPPSVPEIPGPVINRAVQLWLRAEYTLAWWLPFGTSLLMMAGPRR